MSLHEIQGFLLILTILSFVCFLLFTVTKNKEISPRWRRMCGWLSMTLFLVLLLLSVAFPAKAEVFLDGSVASPSERAAYILNKVAEAEEICEKVAMKEYIETDGKRITARPVALCAFKESDRSWHVIRIAIMQPVPDSYKSCVAAAPTVAERRDCVLPYRVVTPDYQVEHLGGYGIGRLTFNVWQGGEHLTVYRTRHVWFDDALGRAAHPEEVTLAATEKNYTPFHEDLRDDGLVLWGRVFLRDRIALAWSELYAYRVPSLAFPGEMVTARVSRDTIEALGVIEQMDDKRFREDPKGTVESVYVEYALNRDAAFRFSRSSAAALGPYQFTNRNGDGTYSTVVLLYPDARLNPDFESGASDLLNVIQAAACLIDLEVAQFPKIREIFAKNPKLGGIYPVAAYNGGHGASRKLYEWIVRKDIDIILETVELPGAFVSTKTSCPCRMVKVRGKNGKIIRKKVPHIVKKVNTETPGYVDKYIWVINYLSDVSARGRSSP